MQVGGGIFDVEVFVLSSPAFCCQQTAAMYFFEIAVRKPVSPLRLLRHVFIYAQVPVGVLVPTMLRYKVVLLHCFGLVFAPGISFVVNVLPTMNSLFGNFE